MDRFRRLDLPIVVTVLFAVLVTAMAGALHQVAVQSECIQLVVASSQEKSTLMQAAPAAFNAKRLVVGGRCINVNVNAVISGAAEQALVDDGWKGQPGARPDVWVPSATTWLQLLDEHRSEHGRASLFARDKPAVSIMQSPLVIAMPEPMARALGRFQTCSSDTCFPVSARCSSKLVAFVTVTAMLEVRSQLPTVSILPIQFMWTFRPVT